jgi:hypothetical protein
MAADDKLVLMIREYRKIMMNIEFRMMNIEYRISNIECRMSNDEYRMTNIEGWLIPELT